RDHDNLILAPPATLQLQPCLRSVRRKVKWVYTSPHNYGLPVTCVPAYVGYSPIRPSGRTPTPLISRAPFHPKSVRAVLWVPIHARPKLSTEHWAKNQPQICAFWYVPSEGPQPTWLEHDLFISHKNNRPSNTATLLTLVRTKRDHFLHCYSQSAGLRLDKLSPIQAHCPKLHLSQVQELNLPHQLNTLLKTLKKHALFLASRQGHRNEIITQPGDKGNAT
ncbi:unnamed protein product, partial [Ectocarpus sp. 4 AP-2014]